ncbi:uracil-DNA glycosylase [Sulfitobacter sp. S190]|uniref:uracil-DNA glycosylase n=1 Tax=Sulfitobacter sp. S190 TaxID=2867022 RepID=UPI0021A5CA2C|nr:uracil-DNA glycosylase [Sulfitobacter sp. S190]UWR23765.1 uracil-DNA glycosylase [Sulfitobacter sp. S190]
MFDLRRLGAWADLPFFDNDLPALADALRNDPRTVLPPADQVFAALERVQPDQVRVVILGQDPYHTPGKAHGLAFSIHAEFGGRLDSLGNIFKEIETDTGAARRLIQLDDWAAQGVLLLNTVLTVPQGTPKGHAKLGWQKLTDQVLHRLTDAPRAYLLWGAPAQHAGRGIDAHANLKIETAHPSPLSAHRGFFGSRPFSRTNDWLQQHGQSAINWGDPEGP